MFLPPAILTVLSYFQPAFSKPTFNKAALLVVGTLLARGRRTVAVALRYLGLQHSSNFNIYHHVLSRGRWSSFKISKLLLRLLVTTFVPRGAPLEIVIDETLERRWGPKITKRGHYRDALLSSKKTSVANSGLRWITMALVVRLPWTRLRWALPFLSVLSTPPKISAKLGKPHKTVICTARQMIKVVHRWLPEAELKLIGDGAYSVVELGLVCHNCKTALIAPLRMDANLHAKAPRPKAGQKGRPRQIGKALAKLTKVLSAAKTNWERHEVEWYGGSHQILELCSGLALWYRAGLAPLPIRWVIVKGLEEGRSARAFFCTDQQLCAEQIVADFVKRWSIEVMFEESRAHLGVETQRQWSDQAIERTTPALFGLYSLVAVIGKQLHEAGELRVQQTAWYPKTEATFSDVLGAVRQALWHNFNFSTSPSNPDMVLIPRSELDRLAYAVCF
jgi:DDE superfamily endonuclease